MSPVVLFVFYFKSLPKVRITSGFVYVSGIHCHSTLH